MTELMKQYEKETGHNAFLTYGITQAICYPTYVEWLEEKLRWRPVSERPEEEGIFLVKRVDLEAELMLYRNGKWWFFDDELFQYLEFDFDIMSKKFQPTHWLPIPPTPEGN